MARRLSMGLHGSGVDGGVATAVIARLVTSPSALVIAVVIAMAAIGGAFIGRQGVLWMPGLIADDTKSNPSADRVGPREHDPARSDHANDDGYLDGLAKAMGYDSVEQMTRAGRPHPPPNLVHR
jgi:hypothetical protein